MWDHDRKLHHSYFICYGHDTLQNRVIQTNPHANTYKRHMTCLKWKYKITRLKKKKNDVEEKKSSPDMLVKTKESMNSGDDRGLVKRDEKNRKSQRWNQITKSPRVREEPNRQREESNRGDLFLTAALSSLLSPVTKQAALMSLVLGSHREPVRLHNIYCCRNKDRKKQTEKQRERISD